MGYGRGAVFLQRDGVLVVPTQAQGDHQEDLVLAPEAVDAIRALAHRGLAVVVIGARSGVAPQPVAYEIAESAHRSLMAMVVAEGGRVDAVAWCPHHADEACGCYGTGAEAELLRYTANAINLDLAHSYLVGDSEEDIALGIAAGRKTARVLTERGSAERAQAEARWGERCGWTGLYPEAAVVRWHGLRMPDLLARSVEEGRSLFAEVELPSTAARLRSEIERRLEALDKVGLGYITLDRPSPTLSRGEAQRVKLAGLLGSGLTSLTVLVDEPSRGLHPSEVEALVAALHDLRDEGNTVIVVEHDPVLIHAADYLIDLGPGAGVAGGEIVAQGKPEEVVRTETLTAKWLRGERVMDVKRTRREPRAWLTITGARGSNLQGDPVHLPLGMLVGVCGVSGSGKTTLIIDTLGRASAPRKQTTSVAREPLDPEPYDAIEGAPARTILVDQAKAGVRSPATYLNLTRPLHALYASSDDAKALGLDEKQLARKCSACLGRGSIRLEMGFLPDVHVPCETCQGTGHLPEAWEVRVQGLAMPELYALTIDQVYDLLGDEEALARPLAVARGVGLGYLLLRQPSYTLSGGEAQRLKIAKELCRKTSAKTLYILDEPTIGQHLEDVARLIGVLHKLVDAGHTVLVVEHHPHLLASCDWLIELGPEGGPDGGQVIATGTPEALAAGDTPTAPYLREVLEAER